MRRHTLVVAGFALALAPSSGVAQETKNNYSLQKVEGGVVRMNNATGEVSMCHTQAGELVCEMAADERNALEKRVEALEKRVDRLTDGEGDTASGRSPDRNLDRAMDAVEHAVRRFFAMIDDLNRDFLRRDHYGEPDDRTAPGQRT
ncbi:hypothetical protein [Pararhizobium mangrovi]|uniref:Uncharacterized protein n=1 Tax=Pararhizobium mangrovi TaxID=2590452 RepID=A0A506TWS4_9HYPH|nr:hypothetical protein [Pararhizobium mangrovi]TPW25746.1 hypothetical protein FJU11_18090 [Pararhizobium mangrovi]